VTLPVASSAAPCRKVRDSSAASEPGVHTDDERRVVGGKRVAGRGEREGAHNRREGGEFQRDSLVVVIESEYDAVETWSRGL